MANDALRTEKELSKDCIVGLQDLYVAEELDAAVTQKLIDSSDEFIGLTDELLDTFRAEVNGQDRCHTCARSFNEVDISTTGECYDCRIGETAEDNL